MYSKDSIISIFKGRNGEKILHINGFFYGTDGGYRLVEYCGLQAPLQVALETGISNFEEEMGPRYSQYVSETMNCIENILNTYDNGNKLLKIQESDITMNTPEGSYYIV